ncbi:MAG: DUF2202 domain-containing protein [Rhodoferax sp.]|uniref:DUF2202 domain-containing protein n=1 Tax=Rhodoferax sp. TaxID=50421 RepID=UPI002608EFF7|nr:DUF2202 domain-containing protein [Rhodoferax sp.]MDD2880045.1 DUF2202 domain-containing protein [Rhodoferax sp.]
MNQFSKTWAVACMVTLALAGCGGGGDAGMGTADNTAGLATNSAALTATLAALPVETLSEAEQESLAFMREEEKLAHDVYIQLDGLWRGYTKVFGNIANSESTHTESVLQLLVRYNLPDPTATLTAGVFQNTTLQNLYTQLLTAGSVSLVEGLKVGATIEEVDMIDINKALLAVDNQDITLVYQNLLKGSRNHLRSFVSTLAKQGVTYVPQYMVEADYLAIVTTPMER